MSNNNDKQAGENGDGNMEGDEWNNETDNNETIFDNSNNGENKDVTETDKAETTKKYVVEEFDSWDNMKLKKNVLRGIYSYGFEKPSPIQKKAIRPLADGQDIIAQAQSGTGKTGAFSVGTLQVVDETVNKTQAIILSPTRELSRQIFDVLTSLGSIIKIRTQLFVGGTAIDNDISQMRKEVPHIAVGCPGRVHDLLRRKHLVSKNIKLIVLDEADEMLSAGFKEQVYNIFQQLSSEIQIGLFSATVPPDINSLANKFMRDPVEILVKTETLTLEGITQFYVALEDDQLKYVTLKDLYGTISLTQCIIYCNSIRRVADLHDAMKEDGFPVCAIHSNLEKKEREQNYADFKSGKYRVLISSNVTARGIDIQQVSTVINFDIPKDIHTYLHRIGRSGRWGRKGVGINFITRRDYRRIKEIEQYYHTEIKELPDTFKN